MVHIKKKPRQPVQCKYCDHICRSDNLKKHLKKHAAEIKLIENYKTIIDSLKEQHTEQIEDLKEQHTEQIEELKMEIQELQEEIQEIKEEKEEEVNALKKENDKLQKENDHLTYTFENMTFNTTSSKKKTRGKAKEPPANPMPFEEFFKKIKLQRNTKQYWCQIGEISKIRKCIKNQLNKIINATPYNSLPLYTKNIVDGDE